MLLSLWICRIDPLPPRLMVTTGPALSVWLGKVSEEFEPWLLWPAMIEALIFPTVSDALADTALLLAAAGGALID